MFYSVFTFLVLTVVRKKRKMIPPFFYVFAISIFALSIYVGAVVTPELPAITFYVFLHIDDFKLYNDTYGHVQGDEYLKEVGFALEQAADVHNIFLGRFGGEEFVAGAIPRNEDELQKTAERFVRCVSELDIQNMGTYEGKITISLGYAGFRETGARDYRQLLDCADSALYVAKGKGKNCAQRWDGSMERK